MSHPCAWSVHPGFSLSTYNTLTTKTHVRKYNPMHASNAARLGQEERTIDPQGKGTGKRIQRKKK